jgi:protoporphyrinogen oxidase
LADPAVSTTVSACALPGGRWRASRTSDDIVLAWPTPDAVDRLRDRSATEIVSAMMPEIERLVPQVQGAVERARLFRFDHGTPLAPPGFIAHRAIGRRMADELPSSITLAGDYLTMPLVEGAVCSGERAAERVVRHLGRA